MAGTVGLLPSLPSWMARPRLSARAWLALSAGLGCGAWAYAGLYPRFDDGELRLILGLTSAPFGAAVVAATVGAKDAPRAFWSAVGWAVLLGAASTFIPAAFLMSREIGSFIFACVIGAFFGAFTGLFYGLPLGILSALGHAHVRANTHDATDRAARASGVWLGIVALIGLVGTQLLDQPRLLYRTEEMTHPSSAPSIVALSVVIAGVAFVVHASRRMKRRRAWIDRVRAGLEPSFRTRVADVRDPFAVLPRLSEGETVIELVLDESAGGAYRAAATGTAVAVVSDSVRST